MSETTAPLASLEVVQVTYGERVTQKSVVLHDYAAYGRPDGDLRMDYNFWIIRSGDTVILKDTGYDIGARDWLGEQVVKDTPEALGLLGIDPAEVTMVITSHFHYSEETEVFPGITVYPVGGHCPGELLTLVRAKSGDIATVLS